MKTVLHALLVFGLFGAALVLYRPVPIRAQVPGPTRLAFNYQFPVTATAPGYVAAPVATVPPGVVVRITGVALLEETGGTLTTSPRRIDMLEGATNTKRWSLWPFTAFNAPIAVSSDVIPDPGLIFYPGEVVAVGATYNPAASEEIRRYALIGWIESTP